MVIYLYLQAVFVKEESNDTRVYQSQSEMLAVNVTGLHNVSGTCIKWKTNSMNLTCLVYQLSNTVPIE